MFEARQFRNRSMSQVLIPPVSQAPIRVVPETVFYEGGAAPTGILGLPNSVVYLGLGIAGTLLVLQLLKKK